MRVALTGADGFTGRFVMAALAERGVDCVALEANLTDCGAVEEQIAGARFDCVIHLAAIAFIDMADWRTFYAVNQIGTFNLLDALARFQPGIRCILASSAQVYGAGAQGLVDEDRPTLPGNHYAVSKHAMEQGVRLWGDRLELVVTRPFNYTGVGQEIEYLVPKIVDHFRRAEPVIELGNLFVRRDFGDVRSVAEAYAGLATCDNPPPLVNICTGATHSIQDILAALHRISGHLMEVRVNQRFVRASDVPVLGGNASRLRAALPDWSPRCFEDTLAWMYESRE